MATRKEPNLAVVDDGQEALPDMPEALHTVKFRLTGSDTLLVDKDVARGVLNNTKFKVDAVVQLEVEASVAMRGSARSKDGAVPTVVLNVNSLKILDQ